MSRGLPREPAAFEKRWPTFKAWLIGRGSEVLATTNPYEVARFTTPQGVGVVYRNGKEIITSWEGGADAAFKAFTSSDNGWRVTPKIKRPSSNGDRRWRDAHSLAARDGWNCVFCGDVLDAETATIEHFLPVSMGGPNHLSNKGLACKPCNAEAGHMSVAEKVNLALSKRTTRP